MKFLIVLSCAVAAAQSAVVLPGYAGYAGLGYHGLGYGVVPTVAKSSIKYKTAAFEPVYVATPADAIKIELVETEHEKEILTPTITYAAHAGLGYTGLGHAGLGYAGLGYAGLGYGHGLGFGYGLPLVAAAPAAVAEE